MPPLRRHTRAKHLVRLYVSANWARRQRQKRHRTAVKAAAGPFLRRHLSQTPDLSWSDIDMPVDDTRLTASGTSESDSSTDTDEFSSSSLSDGSMTSDDELESDHAGAVHSADGLGPMDDGSDADDELSDSDLDPSSDLDDIRERTPLGRWVRKEITAMYAQRYEAPRDRLPRGPSYLRHILTVLKTQRPDHFRQALRVSPATFDTIVAKIEGDSIFCNRSDQAQISVEEQLAVTLYRFGHDGNAASLQSVANWAGLGKGTITLVTRRVITAILRPSFLHDAVRMPTTAEKEEAKTWVEEHSCEAWRGGWCMVDGTLIPLADRPYWFGESYFDRKCNYSLNVQVHL